LLLVHTLLMQESALMHAPPVAPVASTAMGVFGVGVVGSALPPEQAATRIVHTEKKTKTAT
jgi:hypothetical protein